MQRSGVEDEAEEKQRNQDEEKAQEMQRGTQVDEDAWMRRSSQGDRAEEKQWSGKEEEPEEMQSRGDQDEAEHKQPRADEDMECPGLDHPGQNKKERPKRKDHKMQRKESRHPGLEHPGPNKQQGAPAPGLEHLGTRGGEMPRTGASGTEQGAGASRPPDWSIRGQAAAEHHERERRPRRAREGATRARQWRCSEAEWRTRLR